MLMCEAAGNGTTRQPFQLARSDRKTFLVAAAIYDLAVSKAEGEKLASAKSQASERQALADKWGILSEMVGKEYSAEIVCDNYPVERWPTRYSWNVAGEINQSQLPDPDRWAGWGPIDYFWIYDPKTQIFSRLRYRNSYRPMSIGRDGTISGVNKDGGKGKFIEIRRGSEGKIVVERFDQPTQGMRKVKCTETLSEKHQGYFAEMRNLSRQRKAALAARKPNEGGGIGGMLLGAVVGGALTNGTPEGIIAGARAFAPSDATRNQLDNTADDIAADQREQEKSSAEFKAQIAASTLRGNQQQKPSTQSAVDQTTGATPKPSASAPAVAKPTEDPLRYFYCSSTRWERDAKGVNFISAIFYGVVTSSRSLDDVTQRFKQHTGVASGIDGENSSGGCFPHSTKAEADAMVATYVDRDRNAKAKVISDINFSY